jgi:hypothetical protein
VYNIFLMERKQSVWSDAKEQAKEGGIQVLQ